MNTQTMLLTKLVFLAKKLFPVLLIILLFFFVAFASSAWKTATGKQDTKEGDFSFLPLCCAFFPILIGIVTFILQSL